jgi:DNA-binding cell septation regulator SpoVG
MIRKILLSFIFFLFFPLLAYSSLEITDIKQDGNKFNIVLNNAVKIKGISIKKDRNGDFADFPSYTTKGKVYKQFGILRRDFRQYLVEAIKNDKISESGGQISFKINEFSKVKNHKSIEAFCSVIFDDTLEVYCRIMKGKKGLWIAWPSVKSGNKWNENFEFIDLELKDNVTKKLLSANESKK